MTYSTDLRERVVVFVQEGGSKSEAATRFKISRWCVYNWLKRETLTPSKQGCPKPWRLCPEALKAHVASYPDAYQHERAAEFGVSRYAVWYGLRRLKITCKKNVTVRRAKRQLSQ
jgi:transposase